MSVKSTSSVPHVELVEKVDGTTIRDVIKEINLCHLV